MTKPDHRTTPGAIHAALATALLVAGEAHASGDQLVLLPDPVKLVVLLIFFTALIVPMNALIIKPIFRVIDAREEKTTGTRKRAEKLAGDANEMLERYEASIREVRHDSEEARKQTLASARSDGSATTTTARSQAEGEVTRAREEIAAALDEARATLKTQSTALAGEVAARALGRPL